jgi:hypothetical protein
VLPPEPVLGGNHSRRRGLTRRRQDPPGQIRPAACLLTHPSARIRRGRQPIGRKIRAGGAGVDQQKRAGSFIPDFLPSSGTSSASMAGSPSISDVVHPVGARRATSAAPADSVTRVPGGSHACFWASSCSRIGICSTHSTLLATTTTQPVRPMAAPFMSG